MHILKKNKQTNGNKKETTAEDVSSVLCAAKAAARCCRDATNVLRSPPATARKNCPLHSVTGSPIMSSYAGTGLPALTQNVTNMP